MAWWLTVYCCDDVSGLTAEQLLTGLRDGDPEAPAGVDDKTLAEDYEIDESAVDSALSQLRAVAHGAAPVEVALHDGPDTDRPVLVHAWTAPDRLAEEIEECRAVRSPPSSVEPILNDGSSIVGIEPGASQLASTGLSSRSSSPGLSSSAATGCLSMTTTAGTRSTTANSSSPDRPRSPILRW